ncbi:MAG TPA: hypothetical protein VMT54_00175 [Candidatus Cybelea sp.]|nr:hypothetical protein [Candidatus Cybelea sp.]
MTILVTPLRAVCALVALALATTVIAAARADGNPEEQNLTQREFNRITAVEPADKSLPGNAKPVVIHDLTDAQRRDLEALHAVRLIKGREWKQLSPEERDARLRAIREQMPNAGLFLTVPKGDLWALPFGEDNVNIHDVLNNRKVRLWTGAEEAAMPVAVSTGTGINLRQSRVDSQGLAVGIGFKF